MLFVVRKNWFIVICKYRWRIGVTDTRFKSLKLCRNLVSTNIRSGFFFVFYCNGIMSRMNIPGKSKNYKELFFVILRNHTVYLNLEILNNWNSSSFINLWIAFQQIATVLIRVFPLKESIAMIYNNNPGLMKYNKR